MRAIVEARGETQFKDLVDFARRVDLRRVGKRALEMMAKAGAFDLLDDNRARVLASLDGLVAFSGATHDQAASNQSSLFGGGEDLPPPRPVLAPVWLPMEKLGQEHQAIGFYLSGHPIDDYLPALRRIECATLAEIRAAAASGPLVTSIAGTISSRQEKKSAKGNRFAFVGASDPTGLYEAVVFSDTLEASRSLLEPGTNVVMQVQAEPQGDEVKMLIRSVKSLEDAIANVGPAVLAISVANGVDITDLSQTVETLRADRRGRPGKLVLRVHEGDEVYDIEICTDAPVGPAARQRLRIVPGVLDVIEE